MTGRTHSRRQILAGAAKTAAAAAAAPLVAALPGGALAQEVGEGGQASHWRELNGLMADAQQLGFSMPRVSRGIRSVGGDDYRQVMRSTVDLIETVEFGPPSITASADDVERLTRKSHALLRRVHQMERSPPTDREGDNSLAVVPGRPEFDAIKADYEKLFNSCEIREKNRVDVGWYASKLADERYQKQWVQVAQEVCCPWYFVAICHAMEASFDFRAHLHNGDPLSEKTVQVPAKRPPKWNPPSDWVSSAVDALTFDKFADQQDWSLARTLYRWESYNGFRSRRNGINTPYLWSFSNHYSKGKFVADGVWDPNAVSKQCGGAVMLKAIVEKGIVKIES